MNQNHPKHVNIIDPSSSEFNRGSFCYAPYMMYNWMAGGLLKSGYDPLEYIHFYETFKPEDLDHIPDADLQIVCLWSYPQIETALMLAEMLPYTFEKSNVFFVGYTPLIKELGLPHIEHYLGFDPMSNENVIMSGMIMYPTFYPNFKRLLLSDCDMHLKNIDHGQKVYPLFTSYGCPNGCAFCPSTTNCGKKRFELPVEVVEDLLTQCVDLGVHNIHFTDEDFFYDIHRAYHILSFLKDMGMHLIALGSAEKVMDYITLYGVDEIEAAGLEVIEIGFESGDEDLSRKMGVGKLLSACEILAANQHNYPFRIFWLILTFFPGETIHSLNETGEFMKKYGFPINEVVGRLRTNGTKGGLGQFFQPYDGTAINHTLRKNGMFLTERPVRLIPSYIPNSFLNCVIAEIHEEFIEEAYEYLCLYNVANFIPEVEVGMKIADIIKVHPAYIKIKIVTALSLLARFGIIK